MSLPRIIRTGLKRIANPYFASSSVPFGPITVPVTIPTQEDTFWCWAAIATGIALSYGNWAVSQHVVATAVLGCPCKPNGQNPDCHRLAALTDALCATDNLWNVVPNAMKIDDVKRSIEDDRPLCARMENNTSSPTDERFGHFVAITGYSQDGTSLYIQDPLGWYGLKPYAVFLKAYLKVYRWERTYRTKSHKETPHCKLPPKECKPC